MEAKYSSETSIDIQRTYGVILQKIEFFKVSKIIFLRDMTPCSVVVGMNFSKQPVAFRNTR
jgi:hypothetical protein